MSLTFNLREFGHSFATRGRGRELREVLLERLDDGERIVEIDFREITNVSYSFADEFLGVLVASNDETPFTLRLMNVGSAVDRVLQDAMSRRRGELSAC